MRPTVQTFLLCAAAAIAASPLRAQAPATLQPPAANDPVQMLASRLDLTRYKATIKGLTQFGDRRQGTDRNANAVTWIETQLKSYGCANVERITYDYQPAAAAGAAALDSAGRAAAASARAQAAAFGSAQGGGRMRGMRTRTGVNVDSLAQKDLALRALNMQPTKPGMRQEVVCTKVGSTHPDEMYIIGAHMDGHGWGEAANDDGSGTALVMEIARIMSMPDVKTDRSIRFALWNNEETGLNGARAYVVQREALQGKESPVGSGKYPEPKWLGMIQHDMMMFDHGMPRPDGTMSPEQRPEADVNIEFQSASKMATESQKLAWFFHAANEKYATDYPAAVGPHMTNTDSGPFQDIIAAISLRENERGREVGAGWDPQWHQVTDVFSTYTDKDFRLGLNAAQTTLGAIGLLVGATIVR
jgi:hypothetical protein